MNRRNTLFSIFIVIVVSYSLYSEALPLIVHLRCDKGVRGTLQANIISSSGEHDKAMIFDIKKICENGEIKFYDHQREKKIKFTLKFSRDKKAQVISEYGSDIQSDENGYYMVLKITNTLPFIANDRI